MTKKCKIISSRPSKKEMRNYAVALMNLKVKQFELPRGNAESHNSENVTSPNSKRQ